MGKQGMYHYNTSTGSIQRKQNLTELGREPYCKMHTISSDSSSSLNQESSVVDLPFLGSIFPKASGVTVQRVFLVVKG